jgi:hypothetical protein
MATTDIRTQGDKPYYKDIQFVQMKLQSHDRVVGFERVGNSDQLLAVTRTFADTLHVWLSDVYTLGEAEYLFLREQTPEINCIVSVSGYDRYTGEAKEQAVRDHVGLFKIGEFLGALNVKEFWTYVPRPKTDGDANAGRRRRA